MTLPPNQQTPNNRLFPVTLSWEQEYLSVGAFIDSGADESLIETTLARKAGIPLVSLQD